jgi:hypothetical protein
LQQPPRNQISDGHRIVQPRSSWWEEQECAEACLFLVASSILASDCHTAQKYIPLLKECLDSLNDSSDDESSLYEENAKRLEAWQRLLFVPATADHISVRTFNEALPEQEQANLGCAGAWAKLQLIGLASNREFQQQLAMFLQQGARVFGSKWEENCFVTPVKADRCLAEHVLPITTPYARSACESLALLMAEIADIVGYSSYLLTDGRLWARFLQPLVDYSDRYASQQTQSSPADGDTSSTADDEISSTSDGDISSTADDEISWTSDGDTSSTADDEISSTSDGDTSSTADDEISSTSDNGLWLASLVLKGSELQSDFLAFVKATVGPTEGQTDERTR